MSALGLQPAEAERAAVEAFGDPIDLASRFELDFRTRTYSRVSRAVDTIDCWRLDHVLVSETLIVAPVAALIAMLWSPVMAIGFVGPWMAFVWVGRQLAGRHEPGYRRRLWAWKREHGMRYNLVTRFAFLSGMAFGIAAIAVDHTHHLSPVLFLLLVPLYPLIWVLNNPKPYYPPKSTS